MKGRYTMVWGYICINNDNCDMGTVLIAVDALILYMLYGNLWLWMMVCMLCGQIGC